MKAVGEEYIVIMGTGMSDGDNVGDGREVYLLEN